MIAPTTEAIDAAPQIESMGRHSLSIWPQWLAELTASVFYRVLDAAHGRRTDSDENRMEWCCAKVPLALEQLSL
jgi:hypothetical protein